MKRSINKYVYTWVGTFFFGIFGVDRFMRGQIKLGILKLIVGSGGVWIFGLGSVWLLIDWIIALTKLGKYEEDFVFDYDGKWDESYTIEEKAREDAERELREREAKERQEKEKERQEKEKERKEKYKKDIESGAISYDEELKKVQAIEGEFLKYKSYFVQKASEASSLIKEFTGRTSTGSWDTTWYSITVDKIKNLKIDYPSFNTAFLSDLLEVKWDSRVNNLKSEIEKLRSAYSQIDSQLSSYQYSLRSY